MRLIRAFDRFLGEFVQHIAAGCVGVIRQNVAVAEARDARFGDFVVHRHRRCIDADAINRDTVRQQDLQHLRVTGAAAVFLAIADDEDDLAAGRRSDAPVPARPSESRRSAHEIRASGVMTWIRAGNRLAVGLRARAERTADHRRTRVCAALVLQTLQSQRHAGRVAEILALVHRVAVGEHGDFIEGSKRAPKSARRSD